MNIQYEDSCIPEMQTCLRLRTSSVDLDIQASKKRGRRGRQGSRDRCRGEETIRARGRGRGIGRGRSSSILTAVGEDRDTQKLASAEIGKGEAWS